MRWATDSTFHDALHDLCLRTEVVRVILLFLKGVAAAEHGVQHHSCTPDVRRFGVIAR